MRAALPAPRLRPGIIADSSSAALNSKVGTGIKVGTDCKRTTEVKKPVVFTCTLTAVGAMLNSNAGDHFYCQEGNAAGGGMQLWMPGHGINWKRGDSVQVKGIVAYVGDTTHVEVCDIVKSGTAVSVVPLAVKVADIQGCTAKAHGYRGMLVKLTDVYTQPCVSSQCESHPVLAPGGKLWDKYKQMWVGDTATTDKTKQVAQVLEIDNHIYTAYMSCNMDIGTKVSLTGVMGSAYGAHELAPRDINDVGGCVAYPTSMVVKTSIKETKKIDGIKFGNTGGQTVDPAQLGTGEMNSKKQAGTSGPVVNAKFTAEVKAKWVKGSCPVYSAVAGKLGGSKFHNLCSCYMPENYDAVPNNGAPTKVVQLDVTVVFTGGDTSWFYFEDGPALGQGMFIYRKGGAAVKPGYKVRITASTKVYYGNDQLADALDITILSTAGKVSPPVDITKQVSDGVMSPANWCSEAAESIEAKRVSIKGAKVVAFLGAGASADGKVKAMNTYDLQASSCNIPSGGKPDVASKGYVNQKYSGCTTLMEMPSGKRFILDSKFGGANTVGDLFSGTYTGYTGRNIAIGDSFDTLTGIFESKRGGFTDAAESRYKALGAASDTGGIYYFQMLPDGATTWKTAAENAKAAADAKIVADAKAAAAAAVEDSDSSSTTTIVIAVLVVVGVAGAAYVVATNAKSGGMSDKHGEEEELGSMGA